MIRATCAFLTVLALYVTVTVWVLAPMLTAA